MNLSIKSKNSCKILLMYLTPGLENSLVWLISDASLNLPMYKMQTI